VNCPTTSLVYLRLGEQLSHEDMRDLNDYLEVLRTFYDIPTDQPVFPSTPRTARTTKPSARKPKSAGRATGLNRDDHPWRNTL